MNTGTCEHTFQSNGSQKDATATNSTDLKQAAPGKAFSKLSTAEEPLVKRLALQVANDPTQCNAHVRLITALRESGDVAGARKARFRLYEYCPLSPQLWLDWIRDERALGSDNFESVRDPENIHVHFEEWPEFMRHITTCALEDYYSLEVLMETCDIAESLCIKGTASIDEANASFEKALGECSHDVAAGFKIYEQYRHFVELLQNKNIIGEQESRERRCELWKRQLSLPFVDMEKALKEFAVWLDDINDSMTLDEVLQAYAPAKAILDERKEFEASLAQIESSNPENIDGLCHIYQEYLKMERNGMNSSRPRTHRLYERAVTACKTKSHLWKDYVLFVGAEGEAVVRSQWMVARRGVRNCPSDKQLWLICAKLAETLVVPSETIMHCFERAKKHAASSHEDFIDIVRHQASWARRHHSESRSHATREQKIDSIFDRATHEEEETFGLDPQRRLARDWAGYLLHFQDIDGYLNVWKTKVLTAEAKLMASFWLEFLGQLRELPIKFGPDRLRKLYLEALDSVHDYVPAVLESYIGFEYIYGTMATLEAAEKRYSEYLGNVPHQEEEQHEPLADNPSRKRPAEDVEDVVMDQEQKKMALEKEPGPGQPINKPGDLRKIASRVLFAKNLPFVASVEQIQQAFDGLELVDLRTDRQGRSKGQANLVFVSSKAAQDALNRDRTIFMGRSLFLSKFKARDASDPDANGQRYVVLMKGIPVEMSRAELSELLTDTPGMMEFRLITNNSTGASKGFAYIDFDDETRAKEFIRDGSMDLGVSIVHVSMSEPPRKPGEKRKKQEKVKETNSGPVQSKTMSPFAPMMIPRSIAKGGTKPAQRIKLKTEVLKADAANVSGSARKVLNGNEKDEMTVDGDSDCAANRAETRR
eukprot:Clim_evm15s55 gene=Clim_evmTU15s55